MAKEKPTSVRTTVTLDADIKAWVEQRAAAERREFSAQINVQLGKVRDAAVAHK